MKTRAQGTGARNKGHPEKRTLRRLSLIGNVTIAYGMKIVPLMRRINLIHYRATLSIICFLGHLYCAPFRKHVVSTRMRINVNFSRALAGRSKRATLVFVFASLFSNDGSTAEAEELG